MFVPGYFFAFIHAVSPSRHSVTFHHWWRQSSRSILLFVTFIGSFIGGAVAALAAWLVVRFATANLPANDGLIVSGLLIAAAAMIGMLVGASVMRRAWRGERRVCVFSTLAAGVGIGTIVALGVAGLTASYLVAYGQWPADSLGRVFYVLAIPSFALLGWFIGAAVGAAAGFVTGTLLQGLAALRR